MKKWIDQRFPKECPGQFDAVLVIKPKRNDSTTARLTNLSAVQCGRRDQCWLGRHGLQKTSLILSSLTQSRSSLPLKAAKLIMRLCTITLLIASMGSMLALAHAADLSADPSGLWKKFPAIYKIHSGIVSDRTLPTANERSLTINVDGKAAKEVFDSIGPTRLRRAPRRQVTGKGARKASGAFIRLKT